MSLGTLITEYHTDLILCIQDLNFDMYFFRYLDTVWLS